MTKATSPQDAQLQRRKNDLLNTARSAARQLDNVAAALHALDPKTLRELGLPTVNYHDLLDAGTGLGAARRGLETVQDIALRHGAQ